MRKIGDGKGGDPNFIKEVLLQFQNMDEKEKAVLVASMNDPVQQMKYNSSKLLNKAQSKSQVDQREAEKEEDWDKSD